jgi:hypothetical protein
MYVKAINEVKEQLDVLKEKGLVREWVLPYENLLTRLSAAIFFLTPAKDDEQSLSAIADELGRNEHYSIRPNHEKKLSDLAYRITFSAEEKEKNQQAHQTASEAAS